jgi:hypothetical protein
MNTETSRMTDRIASFKRYAFCATWLGLVPVCTGEEHLTPAVLTTMVVIGEPAKGADLPAAILSAYAKGARDITIAPGTYRIPPTGKPAIQLDNWQDAAIHANGVTLIFEDLAQRPIRLNRCDKVTLEGATLLFAEPSFTQGRIKAISEDANGKYVDWQIDAGYPVIDPDKSTLDVVDQNTRLLKPGTGDTGCNSTEARGTGVFRLRQINGMLGAAVVNDWLITRRPDGGSSIIHLDGCGHCTMRGITLQNSGFAAFFETGGEGGHYYVDCRVAPGPKPAGATENQLVGCGADGFHSTGTRTGPTIERCVWEGVLHDDCIAIHGSLQKIVRVEGDKLILEKGDRGGFIAGDPVRISSKDGFFGEFTCRNLRSIQQKVEYLELTLQRRDAEPVTMIVKKVPGEEFAMADRIKISRNSGLLGEFTCKGIKTIVRDEQFLELTLDRASGAPAEAKASNPMHNGAGFKILNCTLGNCRSRGILVKADNGLIEGCTISGCGMSAISIGPEYSWGEADYSKNVTVRDNKLLNNVLNGSAAGVIFIHGDGAIGNSNLTISDNLFDRNYGQIAIYAEDTDGLLIADNRFITSPTALPNKARTILDFQSTKHITLKGNVVENLPPGDTLVNLGKNVDGVTGNDATGITRAR